MIVTVFRSRLREDAREAVDAEYSVQTCEVLRQSKFVAPLGALSPDES